MALNAKRLHELIYTNIQALSNYESDIIALAGQSTVFAKKQQPAWTIVTPGTQFSFAGVPDSNKLKYRINELGSLELIGQIVADGNDPDGATMCQIPSCTPPANRLILSYKGIIDDGDIIACWLQTDGKIKNDTLQSLVSTDDRIYFNEIIPLT